MANVLRTFGSKLLAKLDKLACWCFGHLDEVEKTEQHAATCTCFDGGSHGRIYYACLRCGDRRDRIELIC